MRISLPRQFVRKSRKDEIVRYTVSSSCHSETSLLGHKIILSYVFFIAIV